MKMASNCWNVHQHVQLWQSLVVVKISLVPFFCGKMRQNLLMERKYASTVGMCINLLELASTCWNLHQRVGICINLLELASMCWNWDWKYHQQLESASTCWNYDRNVHPQLEMASIVGMWLKITSTVGMWHQLVGMATENASTIGMCINCWDVASTFGRCIKCWNWAGDWPPWIQIWTSDTMLILVFVRRQWGHIWLGWLIYLLSEVCAIYRNGI